MYYYYYKYFIFYLYNDHKVQPLHIMFPKTSADMKSYDEQIKWMYFLIEDDHLLGKYKTVWDKFSTNIRKEFDSELVYNIEVLKTKINPHGDGVAHFYDKKIPKVDFKVDLFSSNQLRFLSQERWQLLSTSVFKRM